MSGGSAGLRQGAVDAAATAGRFAEEAERDRALRPEVAKALVAAGFARHFVPRRWGGAEGCAVDLLEAAALVGEQCASAAWCGSLTAGAARMGVFLPERGQAELWADGPDAVVAGALIPSGRARAVDGGWRLSGEWSFTSGVDFSDWALVAGLVDDRPWFFAVPRADYDVRDTWLPVGMRGTGSNTLVLADAFVPAHRAFDREDMLRGRAVGSAAPTHAVPLRTISGVLFAAPALGAARGALREWSAGVSGEDRSTRLTAARTATELDLADFLLRRVAQTCDRGGTTPADAVRNPHDCALAVDRLVDVVEALFRTAGSRGQLATSPLQRFWRDLHTLAGHVALRLEPTGVAYGGFLLDAR
ncbi:acyl-CoA dehydrogenase family protein [Saccharothrix variisporea]|uniref:Two-component flavin-dependent monooxygenase n=1 Tax=Saccharothrix variisporea TaxID=543527 RepID=A0A495XKR8_9PSEU|nr:hydrolase [Saccharothrix variisporea]RKT74697.1 two-component flavin-dependent monooxygenase [Saccharothrix variisporea]